LLVDAASKEDKQDISLILEAESPQLDALLFMHQFSICFSDQSDVLLLGKEEFILKKCKLLRLNAFKISGGLFGAAFCFTHNGSSLQS
jgi:hypothetical protein